MDMLCVKSVLGHRCVRSRATNLWGNAWHNAGPLPARSALPRLRLGRHLQQRQAQGVPRLAGQVVRRLGAVRGAQPRVGAGAAQHLDRIEVACGGGVVQRGPAAAVLAVEAGGLPAPHQLRQQPVLALGCQRHHRGGALAVSAAQVCGWRPEGEGQA